MPRPTSPLSRLRWLLAACTLGVHASVPAAAPAPVTATMPPSELTVAVAANFAAPMRKIAMAFERESGHRVVMALGSTGSFYAQVRNGAPFHLLLRRQSRQKDVIVFFIFIVITITNCAVVRMFPRPHSWGLFSTYPAHRRSSP